MCEEEREGEGRGEVREEGRREEALQFKPRSWQRGQSGLNYRTISDGLILAEAPYNGVAAFNWEASRNKLTKGSHMYAYF